MSAPRTSTATPLSTVTSIAQVSGQSCGQAAFTMRRLVAAESMEGFYATPPHRRMNVERGRMTPRFRVQA
jgi:hypothetical protein